MSSLSRTCNPRVFLCARFDSSSFSPSHPFPSFLLSIARARSSSLPSRSAARIPFVCVVARWRWFLSDLCNPLPHIMECRSVGWSSSSTHGVLFDRQVCSFPRSLARRAVQASEDIHFGVIFACFSDSQIKFWQFWVQIELFESCGFQKVGLSTNRIPIHRM